MTEITKLCWKKPAWLKLFNERKEADFKLIFKYCVWFTVEESSVSTNGIPGRLSEAVQDMCAEAREAEQCCRRLPAGPTALVSFALESSKQIVGRIQTVVKLLKRQEQNRTDNLGSYKTVVCLIYSNTTTTAMLKTPASGSERFWYSSWWLSLLVKAKHIKQKSEKSPAPKISILNADSFIAV